MTVHHARSRGKLPLIRLAAALGLTVALAGAGLVPAAAGPGTSGSAFNVTTNGFAEREVPGVETLTNLSHLDFLLDEVPLEPVKGHSTYGIKQDPTALAPWTYADRNDDGSYRRVGGGSLDPETGHWSQGAFNADDISRSAVVYLRHWQQANDVSSRAKARELLRSLTYLQTTGGENAGNVVLWQQPDGTLNESAEPVELPDPSDSGDSYWLARTVWALGEGYAAFQNEDPKFAQFLQKRLHLALEALNRQSLAQYGDYDIADGERVPSWLIADGADASAEAVLGLSAYLDAAPDDEVARRALRQLSEGVAKMSAGSVGQWPYGAILPWTKSQSLWHAWGGMAPAALAEASTVLERSDWMQAAVRDTAQFTAQLLAAGGPDNGWTPTPADKVQIAYGVDSRLQGLVSTSDATGADGLLELAAVTGAWYFGANRSGEPIYDPDTGVTFDGVDGSGVINRNSGAESTIHGQLSMLALDAHPILKSKALGIDEIVSTTGLNVVEAESGTMSGGEVVQPASDWTGEANFSGGAYVLLDKGGQLTVVVPDSDQLRRVYPIVNQGVEPEGSTLWRAEGMKLGSTENGGVGEPGITAVPGKLSPLFLEKFLDPGRAQITGVSDSKVAIDALMLQPLISSIVVDGPAGKSTVYVSAGDKKLKKKIEVPPGYELNQRAFDSTGQLVEINGEEMSRSGQIVILPGGFTVAHLEEG